MSELTKNEVKDILTAYADNELTDPAKIAFIEQLIETDPEVRFEYMVQQQAKKFALRIRSTVSCPGNLKSSILDKIKNTSVNQRAE